MACGHGMWAWHVGVACRCGMWVYGMWAWNVGVACRCGMWALRAIKAGTSSSDAIFGPSSGQHFKE